MLFVFCLSLLIITIFGAGVSVSVRRRIPHVTHHGHHHHPHELTVFIASTSFFLPATTFFLSANSLILSPFSLRLSLIMTLLHLGHHIHLHYFQHVTHSRVSFRRLYPLLLACGSMPNASLENTLVRQ